MVSDIHRRLNVLNHTTVKGEQKQSGAASHYVYVSSRDCPRVLEYYDSMENEIYSNGMVWLTVLSGLRLLIQ